MGVFFFGGERVGERASLQGYDISYLWLVNIFNTPSIFFHDVGRKSDETTIWFSICFSVQVVLVEEPIAKKRDLERKKVGG